jgi:glycosyltransferase involved in cell wall biosynthesis
MKVTVSVGGKWHAFYLSQQLHRRGYLHKLITSYPKFKVPEGEVPSNSVVSLPAKEVIAKIWGHMPYLNNRMSLQWILSSLYDKQARNAIDHCDLFVGWSSFSLETIRKAKQYGAVTVLERCSSHIEIQRDLMKGEYHRWGISPQLPDPRIVETELSEYQEADYISIPSQFVKETFIQKGISEKKLIHVPYGVDLSAFRQVPKTDKTFRVIFAGGMSLRKGIHYLLQAFSELKLPQSELWLLGSMSKEARPFFNKYEGSFQYKGHIPQRDLYKYYSQGSVFVLFSIEEGLACVQAQAMACGLPVICSTNTGGQDIIREGQDGFILPIRDVKGLKEKLSYLYENPGICKAMGASARKRVRQDFSWDDYGNKIISRYADVLKK